MRSNPFRAKAHIKALERWKRVFHNFFSGQQQEGSTSIVPSRSVASSTLTSVVAIMSCLACLTVAAVTLISDAAQSWTADLAREMTIEVLPADDQDMATRLQAAAGVAKAIDGVENVRIITQEDSQALLSPWLGAELDLSELPLPGLVAMSIDDVSALDLNRFQSELNDKVPGSTLDNHRVWTDHLVSMAYGSVGIGLAVLVLVLTATILCVIFATRAAMSSNREVVDVLHFVGASPVFVARQFQRHFLLLGLKGGLFGGLAAVVSLMALSLFMQSSAGEAQMNQMEALMGIPRIGWTGYLAGTGIIGLIALLTAATSRMTVYHYLHQGTN
jgi:cell division transport system permease protein